MAEETECDPIERAKPSHEELMNAYTTYKDTFERLVKYEHDAVVSIDRWMLALPSAGVVFALGTAATLTASVSWWTRLALAVSIIGFVVSILAAMFAKALAYLAGMSYLQVLHTAYRVDPLGHPSLVSEMVKRRPKWDTHVHRLNITCFTAFVVSVLSLTVFGVGRSLQVPQVIQENTYEVHDRGQ